MIAIVGADGAGKSTVTAAVHERMRADGRSVRLVDRWDVVGGAEYPTAGFLVDDSRFVRSCTARMSSVPRFLFLMWASVLSLTDRHPGRPPGEVVLVDGYWMKHAASEVAYGLDRSWVEDVTAGLPEPDLVVYLRCDAATTWQRKTGAILPYECGMDLSCAQESFLAHQETIHRVLDDWADERGWLVVDTRQPAATVIDSVYSAVSRP